jgi:hypothetical protein
MLSMSRLTQTKFSHTVASLAVLVTVMGGTLWAQNPPYNQPPDVERPFYRVRYDGATGADELRFPVSYTLWIPSNVKRLRGLIVHQHGCGEGSCKSGQTGAFDLHWQALAQKHSCALLSPSYEQPEGADCQLWCDPRNGSAKQFQGSLVDLGNKCGHPELATVPWTLWGHSGGGHWVGGMLMLYPKRVAAAWLRSGVPLFEAVEGRAIRPHALPKEALEVPIMCNLGTKEGVSDKTGRFKGVWPANQAFFAKVRGEGGFIGIAVDPLTSHECGNQRYLAIPWFDHCLTQRLPTGEESDVLNPMPSGDTWLATISFEDASAPTVTPLADFAGPLEESIWLPNESIAKAWEQYVKDTLIEDRTPPPAPTNIMLDGNELSWSAVADLESGISHFIIERKGMPIARVPEKSKNPYGRPIYQGLQYSDTPTFPLIEMRYTIESDDPGEPSEYRVIAVNTAGLSSGD